MYENTIAYRLRIFLDCYHISLRFIPLVLRPLAGTVIIFGIHTMGGGGLGFFLPCHHEPALVHRRIFRQNQSGLSRGVQVNVVMVIRHADEGHFGVMTLTEEIPICPNQHPLPMFYNKKQLNIALWRIVFYKRNKNHCFSILWGDQIRSERDQMQ